MSGHFIGSAIAAVGDFLSGPTACAILFVVGYNIEFSRDSLVGAVRAAGVRLLFCAAFCVICILFLTWTVGMTDLLRWALILLFTLPGRMCCQCLPAARPTRATRPRAFPCTRFCRWPCSASSPCWPSEAGERQFNFLGGSAWALPPF